MAADSGPDLPQSSLILKLPYNYCTKCADVLQRWCEPVKPFEHRSGWFKTYDSGYAYTTDPERFLSNQNNSEIAEWLWHISDLKASARHCQCCNFIVKTLNASPWMAYGDDDFIVLKSQLVGSKHSGALATPHERDAYDRQFEYSRPAKPYSKYDRYHRPMLKLYRKRKEKKDTYGSHVAGDFTFILPLARPDYPSSNNPLDSQIFHGRPVAAEADISLIQQWFRNCNAKHINADTPLKSRTWRQETNEDCVPKPRPKIPHFRLIDVKQRCIVLAQDQDEYAALSYVWGYAKRLLLTVENMARLSTPAALSSDREEVPQTFKDALSVAERLNIAFLWIDAVCVLQDNEDQLVEHMNAMDSIYSSAILTIVSDTDSAGSGIPGISVPRGPPQVIFKYGSETYISAKRTFGKALSDSCWESRAWCLQEKIFSKRLLVFNSSQAFYHCASTTWFEDTIMELREHNYGSVSIAERASTFSKGPRHLGHTAYEGHQKLFGRNFWSLIEVYFQRQLSFESDSVRAFSGILKSVESEYGPAHWGVPEYCFTRGITWSQYQHKLGHRRPEFPSWSWASWRGKTGSEIQFGNVQTHGTDIWNIDWHFHKLNGQTKEYELTPMGGLYTQRWTAAKPVIRRPKHEPGPKKAPKPDVPESDERRKKTLREPLSYISDEELGWDWQTQHENFGASVQSDYIWALPDHPGEEDYVHREMPAFEHNPSTMPPISHIVRFFTSCAKLFIDTEPDLEYHNRFHPSDDRINSNYYKLSVPSTKTSIGHVQLDPVWEGKGKEHEFIFVSRSFWPPTDSDMEAPPVIIWIMLLEGLEGAPEIKRRVQLCGPTNISTWRLAGPVWKCVTLA